MKQTSFSMIFYFTEASNRACEAVKILDVCREVKAPPCSPACVCVSCFFFQNVIVILLAQSVIAVMAQDIVYVRRALQAQSVRSVYTAICGKMAANVSRTSTLLLSELPDCYPPLSSVSFCCLSPMFTLSVWFPNFGWRNVPHMRHMSVATDTPHTFLRR